MTLPVNITDREFDKFVDDSNSETSIRIKLGNINDANKSLSTSDHLYESTRDGKVYSITKIYNSVVDKTGSGFLILGEKLNNTNLVDSYLNINAAGEWHVYLYETPTIAHSGSQLTARNMNRSSSGTISAGSFYHTPDINPNGTCIYEAILGDKRNNLSSQETELWNLDFTKDYYVYLENKTGGAGNISIQLEVAE